MWHKSADGSAFFTGYGYGDATSLGVALCSKSIRSELFACFDHSIAPHHTLKQLGNVCSPAYVYSK